MKVSFNKKLVAITAPTHQAVKILREKCNIDSKAISFLTTHSFLGLREQINPDGTIKFVPQGQSKAGSFEMLVVDEASMLGKEILELILKAQAQFGFKIIFIGDLGQLPPVGEEYSLVFSSDYPSFRLTEVIRQSDDNPLKNLIKDNSLMIFEEGQVSGTKGWYQLSSEQFKQEVMHFYRHQSYKNDNNFVRILCWTNKWVAYINNFIREELWGEDAKTSRYMPNERLIVKTPYVVDDEILLHTNQEVEVESVKEGFVTFGDVDFKSYFCRVKYLTVDREVSYREIPCIHEDSEKQLLDALEIVKQTALSFPPSHFKRGENWALYYKIKAQFADVAYGYAQTVHTSQGSTYHNTFIFYDDIMKNRDSSERVKLIYTALTRACNFAFIVKK